MPVSRAAKFVSAFALLTAIAASTPGYTQDDMRAKGDRACKGDAVRLCKDVLGQGDMIVLSCFQENKPRLSASCRKFLIDVGQLN